MKTSVPMKILCRLVTLLFISTALSHAQVPQLLDYDGYLIENKKPANGVRTMEVRVHDAAVKGKLLYSEKIGKVSVADGEFYFQYGSKGIATALQGTSHWLEIVVNGKPQSPRERLISVPFALRSADAQTLVPLVSSLAGNLTTMQTQNTALSSSVAAVSSNLTAVSSNVAAFYSDLTTAQAAITSLSGNLSTIQSQNTALSSNVAAVSSNLTAVSSNVAAFYSDLTTAQAAITSLSGNLSTIQSQNTALSGSVAAVSSNLTAAQATIASLSSNVTALQGGSNSQNGSAPTLASLTQTLIALGILPVFEPNVTVTTLAGSGNEGYADGQGTAASFKYPYGVAVDGSGNVYVADSGSNRIRKITPGGLVTTLAGSGNTGYADGQGTAASFKYPNGVAVDGSGNVYVADSGNHRIRKITPGGLVTTLAGSVQPIYQEHQEPGYMDEDAMWHDGDSWSEIVGYEGSPGYADGQGTAASFSSPYGVAVDGSGNVYVGDTGNHRIRKITPGGLVTTLAGSGSELFADGQGTAASFFNPAGVAVDGSGNVYVADSGNTRIRKITPGGLVTTLAGNGEGGSLGIGKHYTDAQGTLAVFYPPSGVAVDGSGNVYVSAGQRIRKITASGNVTTLAGLGTADYADGQGAAASFNYTAGVAVDGSGNVYVADSGNLRIRKITISE